MTSIIRERKKGVRLGRGWSLLLSPLLIPALFIAAGLSIPYALVSRHFQRRRSRALEQEMKSAGRLITWSDLNREMEQAHGTLIIERYSFKGPVDCWWTADYTYPLCPHPVVDWLTMANDKGFQPVSEWYKERYTNPRTGRALLVARRQAEKMEMVLAGNLSPPASTPEAGSRSFLSRSLNTASIVLVAIYAFRVPEGTSKHSPGRKSWVNTHKLTEKPRTDGRTLLNEDSRPELGIQQSEDRVV